MLELLLLVSPFHTHFTMAMTVATAVAVAMLTDSTAAGVGGAGPPPAWLDDFAWRDCRRHRLRRHENSTLAATSYLCPSGKIFSRYCFDVCYVVTCVGVDIDVDFPWVL